MNVRNFIAVFASIILVAFSLLAQAPAPRKSPELSITKPSGDDFLLSSFKGKVVVMEFMFIGSPHCLRLAQMLNNLQGDLGPRGLQSIAVAFGPHSDQAMIGHVAEHLGLSYPLGYTTSDNVDAYLGREGTATLKIPQLVVIDRKGTIRASTGTTGTPTLEDETLLRVILEPLLKESSPSDNATRSTPETKKKGRS
jgi:peroxiredoxin